MKVFQGYQKGINLGGWISQCSYNVDHYETFLTKEDIKTIASWGLDHVRLPVDYDVIEGVEDQEVENLKYIDQCIQWCKESGLNLVLDLHRVPGYRFDRGLENSFFVEPKLQERFLKIWTALAKRYGSYSDMVAFELLNEIVEQDSTRWNTLVHKAIDAIRPFAPDTKIIIGGIQWSSPKTLQYLEKPQDENVVFTFHFYEPFLFTHQYASWLDQMPKIPMHFPGTLEEYQERSRKVKAYGSGLFDGDLKEMGIDYLDKMVKEAVKGAEEKDAPLYCGEYGVIRFAPQDEIPEWFSQLHEVFEKYQIGRAAWTYRSMDFGISDQYEPEVRKKVIRSL